MTQARWWVVGSLTLLAACLVVSVAVPSTEGRAIAIWPIGLVAGALVRAPRSWRAPTLGLAFVLGAVSFLATGADAATVLLYAATSNLAAAACAAVVSVMAPSPVSLRSALDLGRYLAGCAVAGVVGLVGSAVTTAVVGLDDVWRTAVTLGAATMASHLVLVPAFLRLPAHRALARPVEHSLQWATFLVATPLLYFGHQRPSLVFLVIPLLAWAAFRLRAVESMAQLIAVMVLSVGLAAADRGPFTDVSSDLGVPLATLGLILAAFVGTCALIVVPLLVRFGEYVDALHTAANERDLVRSIVDSATGVAIVGADAHGRISLFNPGAERLLGYAADDVLGQSGRMFHSPERIREKAAELGVADSYAAVVNELIAQRRVGEHVPFVRKDGVERVHAMTINELVDEDGERIGYLSTSEDVTDELVAKHALQEALDSEKLAVERLREVDTVKDAFVSTVSHELRTPITSILGYVEMLTDGSFGTLEAAQLDALLRVTSNSSRLLRLIDDLLSLSRVSEHGLAMPDVAFDLGDAVDAAFTAVTPSWRNRPALDVSWQRPPGHAPMRGDRDMVERLVVNLLGNAVKFTPDGGSVRVELTSGDGAHVVAVSDTGIGIPEEEQGLLFTRFFRSQLALGEAIPGSGLGLSISKAIAEQHGGTIEVRSKAGQGTTMVVTLPALRRATKVSSG